MNKILKGLLVAALAISANVQAHTNKTFLMPRSHGVNLPMELATFNEVANRTSEDQFGGNFQATVFYNATADEDETGEYFGIKGKSTFNLQYGDATTPFVDLDAGLILHHKGNAAANPHTNYATLSLDPEQHAWGVRLDYYQNLDKLLKGLYFKVALPIVHVENDMELGVKGLSATPADAAADEKTIKNYFKGAYAPTRDGDVGQVALTHAKIDGERDRTGVADIDLVLGYKFLNKENYHVALNLGLTIPTGNESEGEFVFEPMIGNCDHFGFGGGLDASARIWGDDCHNLKINVVANYRYLFENDEKRTLGIKGVTGVAGDWSQYYLLGKVVSPTAAKIDKTDFIPAANITTQNVDVTPGSQLDAIFALAYNNGGFCVDLGYNLFWKDEEDIDVKSDPFNSQYVIVKTDVKPDDGGDFTATNGIGGVLTKANLDKSVAETPSQVTHKIYGSLGYIFREWECPVMFGLMGGYEFAGENSALEKWEIGGKIGVGF